jgi:hypothetical protein
MKFAKKNKKYSGSGSFSKDINKMRSYKVEIMTAQ